MATSNYYHVEKQKLSPKIAAGFLHKEKSTLDNLKKFNDVLVNLDVNDGTSFKLSLILPKRNM